MAQHAPHQQYPGAPPFSGNPPQQSANTMYSGFPQGTVTYIAVPSRGGTTFVQQIPAGHGMQPQYYPGHAYSGGQYYNPGYAYGQAPMIVQQYPERQNTFLETCGLAACCYALLCCCCPNFMCFD